MAEALTSSASSLVSGVDATTSRVPGVAPSVAPISFHWAAVVPMVNTYPSLRAASRVWPLFEAVATVGVWPAARLLTSMLRLPRVASRLAGVPGE